MNSFDNTYHSLLKDILENGIVKPDRTGTGTVSVFGRMTKFDISKRFPLITTKKIHLKSVIHELLWMLSGSDNIQYLKDNGVRIWDEWADNDGSIGPVYGVQWRSWPTYDSSNDGETAWQAKPIDQVAQIIEKLRTKPWDRRIMLSAWNVAEIDAMGLPPCHFNAQFNVEPMPWPESSTRRVIGSGEEFNRLNCLMNIRSWDTFLGGPFNIAQYALLTMMLAQVAGLKPGILTVCSGDTHIYLNHLDQVKEQLSREPRDAPIMTIDSGIKEIDDFKYEHFKLDDYNPHPHIAGKVSV